MTSLEIFNELWRHLLLTPLKEAVPTFYADHYPIVSSKSTLESEFVVVSSLTNVVGDLQVATLNVNIYVQDLTPTINRQEQRYPNRNRLMELTKVAFESLKGYPLNERWFFDVSSETLISEEEIPYTLSNIKVNFKKY